MFLSLLLDDDESKLFGTDDESEILLSQLAVDVGVFVSLLLDDDERKLFGTAGIMALLLDNREWHAPCTLDTQPVWSDLRDDDAPNICRQSCRQHIALLDANPNVSTCIDCIASRSI